MEGWPLLPRAQAPPEALTACPHLRLRRPLKAGGCSTRARPLRVRAANTHVVLRQLVDGHLGLQQVAVEGDDLVAQRPLLFLIVLALGRGRGQRKEWSVVSRGVPLGPPPTPALLQPIVTRRLEGPGVQG